MKQFSALQWQLLDWLADGHWHKGNSLGERLGISRTAVWKHIRQLTQLGVPIDCSPQRGYQLTAHFKPLREANIRRYVSSELEPLSLHVLAEVDSTNRFLKDMASGHGLAVACSEKQTQGRGRFGRTWQSPFGENIYLSSRWTLDCCLSRLSALSLVISLALVDGLRAFIGDKDLRIKWPNDLLWQDKKLCGVLIEAVAEPHAYTELVIGVGLNVNSDTHNTPLPDRLWCSLYEMTGQHFDRNEIIASLLTAIHRYLTRFMAEGFACFHQQWQALDYLQGQHIECVQAGSTIRGLVTGVTMQGQLCLVDEHGVTQHLSSGDTSLKRGVE